MHAPAFIANHGLQGLPAFMIPVILAAIVWTLVLKGFALWYAARGHQKWWFVFLLVLNTLGILEIIYLIWFRPRTSDTHASMSSSSSTP